MLTHGYRGYVSSRSFGGQRVPQHVQNLVIRDYCRQRGLTYLLSATEYAMPESFLMLHNLIDELDNLDGIVAYSLAQLPEASTHRNDILSHVFSKGKTVHFAMEAMALSGHRDIERIEIISKLQRVLPYCPTTISSHDAI